jgi:hypothetical protein
MQTPMKLTRNAAKALRDGGIDATAALDSALAEVLLHSPADQHAELCKAFGQAMAGVLQATVEVALQAHPELTPDRQAWMEIAKASAARRGG